MKNLIFFGKIWYIAKITKMWHRDMKWVTTVGKMAPVGLLDRVATNICKKIEKNSIYEAQ